MAVGYRSLLRLERTQDAVSVAEEQLRSWFREKSSGRRATLKAADWDGPGTHRLGPSSTLHVVHEDHEGDASKRRLYRLVEENSYGQWVVSLFVAALPGAREHRQTIVVEVDRLGVDRASALQTVDPPKIVTRLLDTTATFDGRTPLSGSPAVIRQSDVETLVDAIADPARTASVVAAVSFDRQLDEKWLQVTTSLTRQSVGVAASFVVFADAADTLRAALPESHRIEPGRIRTFLPRVDFDEPTDSARHKWLGPASLERSLEGTRVAVPLQRRHAEMARRRFVEAELPSDVRRTMEILRRAETGIERAARVATRLAQDAPQPLPSVPAALADTDVSGVEEPAVQAAGVHAREAAASWIVRARELLRRWLGAHEPSPRHLDDLDHFITARTTEIAVAEEQLLEAAGREDELQTELQELRGRLEDMELDLAQAESDGVALQVAVAALRQRISASERPQDAYIEPDPKEWEAPDSIEELLARLAPGPGRHVVCDRIVFTGQESHALEIDRRYQSGLYARTMWQYVRVLYDYAGSKMNGFNGGVHMYLKDDRAVGHKCSPDRHAATESDSVLNNSLWRAERMLPVPAEVAPERRVLMDAHFKPTHRDTFAPRMHYFDDVDRSGKIYIGYIGRHLTNTKS